MTTDAHGRPAGPPPSFTDADVRAPSHAERARTLVAGQHTGTLATLALEPAGHPYASFLTFASYQGEPVFLISRIAEHTRNLSADPRASLLVHESGKADPLANGRVTLLGVVEKLPRGVAGAREAYLTGHPQSSYYVDYADFDFWQLHLSSVRYIGGYGRMSWVEAEDFRLAEPDPLASAAARILEHMNQDHADSVVLYARAFTRAATAEHAVMTAIDRYGFELTVTTPEGVEHARIAFAETLTRADDARNTLVALVREAEARLSR